MDAIPIVLGKRSVEDLVETVARAHGTVFGGINLEDISAPRCFEIEEQLKSGWTFRSSTTTSTAPAIVVVLAGPINGCRVLERSLPERRVVVAGRRRVAVTKLLQRAGVRDIVV